MEKLTTDQQRQLLLERHIRHLFATSNINRVTFKRGLLHHTSGRAIIAGARPGYVLDPRRGR